MKLVLISLICTGIYLALGKEKVPIEEISNAFKELDADNDGKVTFEEIKENMERKKTSADADHEGIAQSIYEFYDKDKDGAVSLKEFLPRHDEL